MASIQTTKKIIKAGLDSKVGTWLWGAPGIGKSEIVKQVADELGLQFIDVRAALTEAADWTGLPVETKDQQGKQEFLFLMASFLPKEANWKGIIFLDELNRANKDTLNGVMQLVLDGKILNHYTLPKGAHIVAAGNPSDDNESVTEIGDALIARFCHINLSPTVDEWLEYATTAKVRSDMISFIRTNPKNLHGKESSFTLEQIKPNPRSITRLAAMVNALEANGDLDACLDDVSAGFLGTAIGLQYTRHVKENYVAIDSAKIIPDYKAVRKMVKKAVDEGKLPEQKQALEELFEKHVKDAELAKNEAGLVNVLTFLTDISADVAYIALDKIFKELDAIQAILVKWVGNPTAKNHKVAKTLYDMLEHMTEVEKTTKVSELK